jgi:NAD(P)H dehydrogenase (quinone)
MASPLWRTARNTSPRSGVASAMTPIAVTGSTGLLGGRIARRLEKAGVAQRLLVREPTRAPKLTDAEAVPADYGDTDAVAAALDGIRTVLMVSASETPDRVDRHKSFIDGAVRAGVDQLVYISFYRASPSATFTLARDHWATEEYIKRAGLAYTILRDNLYADFFGAMVGEDGVIRGPAGDGRVAAVAQDDIADVAAAVLQQPVAHRGATYNLTGPEALTLGEVATMITEVTGRTVTFQDETLDEAYASRAIYGAPAWQVDAWVSTYTAIAAGELDGVSVDVERISGHPATSLASLLRC